MWFSNVEFKRNKYHHKTHDAKILAAKKNPVKIPKRNGTGSFVKVLGIYDFLGKIINGDME